MSNLQIYKTYHRWFSLHLFVSFMGKKPPIKFYGIFDQFLRTYEVSKFWMINLYLNLSDIMHTNEHKKHANCGLHVNFWNFLLMLFCFMMKKDHFKDHLKNHFRSPLRKKTRLGVKSSISQNIGKKNFLWKYNKAPFPKIQEKLFLRKYKNLEARKFHFFKYKKTPLFWKNIRKFFREKCWGRGPESAPGGTWIHYWGIIQLFEKLWKI